MLILSDDPASQIVPGRAKLAYLGSPESLSRARAWLDARTADHVECPGHEPVDLPTRLVQVSPLEDSESAWLCCGDGEKGRYCALSYCWGGPQPFSTTITRLSDYFDRLPYRQLPQTIIDAFQVARSLGIHYIWIDSLCIVQDDQADVQSELSKMLQIYKNALFVISAASTTTCHEGFFHKRHMTFGMPHAGLRLPLQIDRETLGSAILSRYMFWEDVGEGEDPLPINTRAWTLQEAYLATRLLVFTHSNMMWECSKPDRGPWIDPDSGKPSRLSSDECWRRWLLERGYVFMGK